MPRKKNHGLASAAKAVRVHPATIVRWLKDGKVPSVKMKKDAQGRWVFTKADIAALKRYKNSIRTLD